MRKKQAVVEEKNTEIKNQILGQAILNNETNKNNNSKESKENEKLPNTENKKEDNKKEENKNTKNSNNQIENKKISKNDTTKKNNTSTIQKESSNKNENIPESKNDNTSESKIENIPESKSVNINEKQKESNENIENNTFHQINEKSKYSKPEIVGLILIIFLIILFAIFIVFTLINLNNTKIINGISVLGIDISSQSKEDAIQTISSYISKNIPTEIKLKHNDYKTSIATENLNISFDIEKAVNEAYSIGRSGNILQNNLEVLKTAFSPININPDFSIDEEQLKASLSDISTKLPDTVIQSSYYIEGNSIILTKGRTGYVVNVDEMSKYIIDCVKNLNVNGNSLEIITEEQSPKALDIDAIHSEIYKEASDAYFTQNPYAVYPSENGLDFAISVEEAKAMLQEDKEEYTIPLKTLYPNVTTNMIGQEAFPDLLSSFPTYYSTSDRDRTTNLILAANKINGTVVMPGEVFSYNQVVGERTIAAGYKEAPIYVNGEVVDGLGGGICQVTSTLYNAVVLANLEIVERSNHQFVPSYVKASRDATVVYGSIDFKFKNNRNYPIKILCSVNNGVVNFAIYGLKTADDYEVEISSRITSQTSSYTNSEAYKILKKNGQIVSQTLLSRDTYKRH